MEFPKTDCLAIYKVANGYVLVPGNSLDERAHVASHDAEVLMGVSMWLMREVVIDAPEPPTPSTHEETDR